MKAKKIVGDATVVGDHTDHDEYPRGEEYEVKVSHIIGDRFGGSIRTRLGVSVGDFPFDVAFDVPQIGAYGVVVQRPDWG